MEARRVRLMKMKVEGRGKESEDEKCPMWKAERMLGSGEREE